VFIDGHAGTTGLRIREWFADRTDLELLSPGEASRKDPQARRELLNRADLVVLCLPDETAREAVTWVENPATKIVDASSAHRVAEGWTYGLPEATPEQRNRIAASRRVSNAGCYPVSVILGLRPLLDAGLLSRDAPITVHALSGYSGGGRSKIERWEDPSLGLSTLPYEAPYALAQVHKHVAEMTRYSGLEREPQFIPAVGPFKVGMRVEIPLHADLLPEGTSAKTIWEALQRRYAEEPFVCVAPLREDPGEDERDLDPRVLNGTNRVELQVVPNPLGHVLLVGRLDNLGKGAAGTAIQNLNLMLGRPETEGLPA
jgi:N-acetyl-gamma-glutamyl-phosphate reductase